MSQCFRLYHAGKRMKKLIFVNFSLSDQLSTFLQKLLVFSRLFRFKSHISYSWIIREIVSHLFDLIQSLAYAFFKD